MQAVSGRIEAAVEGKRARRSLPELRSVRAIGDQTAPLQFFEDVHRRRKLSRLPARFTRGISAPSTTPAHPRVVGSWERGLQGASA